MSPTTIAERLAITPEVRAALSDGRAVVALESTVISHGLPHPQNIELAREMERIIRESGAVPATIALADGRVHVGLSDGLLERLATQEGISKVSLRDIGLVLAEGALGATTVAGTMWVAHQAGIRVFATGGIGGVHPGKQGDISADLPALATIPVCVVSSGAKAILDLPRTREWLETWGVPVLGWQSNEFPAFYSRESELGVDRRVERADDAARYIAAHLELGRSGVLLGVPVPETDALGKEEMMAWIAASQERAFSMGVGGYSLTPFLLADLATRSEGQTLRSNLALLKNNARVGAEVAVALAARG